MTKDDYSMIPSESLIKSTTNPDQGLCAVCNKPVSSRRDNVIRHHRKLHLQQLKALAQATILIKSRILTREAYLENLMEISTVNNLPFTFWGQPCVKLNQQGYCEAFNVTCSARAIHGYMTEFSDKIRKSMEQEMKNRLISLKFDIATRKLRSVLGISVQFISQWKTQIRYLGMVEVAESTSAIHLRQLIDQRLEQFGLDLTNIYSVTTDNGGNVLRTSKDMLRDIKLAVDGDDAAFLESHLEICMDDDDDDDEDEEETSPTSTPLMNTELLDHERSFSFAVDEDEQETPIILGHELHDDYEYPNQDDEDEDYLDLDTLHGELQKLPEAYNVKETRCGAHVIQLAVKDFMKINGRVKFVKALKKTVKAIRLFISKLPPSHGKRPRLPAMGNDTRWNSNYQMVCIHCPIISPNHMRNN